jgi:membrane-associated phospholipid phosphatase
MSNRVRPVDVLLAGFNLVLAWIWSGPWSGEGYAPWLSTAHACGAALPWLLGRWPGSSRRPMAPSVLLRDWYPYILLLGFWSELGLSPVVARAETYDALVAGLDLALFGQHLNLIWMPSMPDLWLSELMHLSYFAYYPMIFVPPLLMAVVGRRAAFRDITIRLMVTYVGCYLVYLAFPVIGPAELMPHYSGPLTDGTFYRLTHAARQAGDSLGTAFPSSHAAGAVTSAFLAWRWFRPLAAWLITVQAVGVLLATVYTQNHFAVDTLAGLCLALTLQVLAVPALLGACARERLVPVLPVRAPGLVTTTGGGL